MPAVGLARESSDDASKELAYEYQVDRLIAYGCKWVFGDRISGTRDDRKGLQQALEKLKSGEADELVVTHLTRLARSRRKIDEVTDLILQLGARLTVLDNPIDLTTPEGRFALQIRAGLAQLEAELGTERQKIGWMNSRQKARPRAPVFGYLIQDGRYVLDEEYTDLAIAIIEKFEELHSLNAVARWLNQEYGHLRSNTRQRRPPYTSAGVKKWLLNPVLCGIVQFSDGTRHYEQHPAILDRSTQLKFQEIVTQKISGTVRTHERRHAYSGLVFCGVCGAKAAKLTTPKHNGEGNYIYYRCSKVRFSGCDNGNRIKAETIDDFALKAISDRAELIAEWLAAPGEDVKPMENSRVLELQRQIDWLISSPQRDDRILAIVQDLELEIKNLTQSTIESGLNLEDAAAILNSLKDPEFWGQYAAKEKFDRLRAIIKRILIQESGQLAIEFQSWLCRD